MKKSLIVASIVGLAGIGLAACDVPGSTTMSATPTPTADSMVVASPSTDAMMGSPSPMASAMSNEEGVMVGGAMMVKSKDIVTNAMAANNVTTLVAAVKAAGLVATLQAKGPYTVFAPTNDAFNKLPAGTVDTLLKPENKTKLATILKYHVVVGRYTSADLKDGQVLKTVEGENLTVHYTGGVWSVTDVSGNTAMIQTADVISSNGVTFVVDTVLMPKNM